FARVDFTPNRTGIKQEIFIGLKTLQVRDTYNTLVCDWRAPIASLFYDDFNSSDAFFNAPSGVIDGKLLLKRQYKFQNGELKGFVNSDIKIDDDILRDVLGENTHEHLRVIVNSIQREQNKAIRYSDSKNLIVYGPAGSGKTSVGFHRIAYLLYRNRKELISSEIVMFSNNDIFSSYVADIIPELGEMPINYSSFYNIFKAELSEYSVLDYYDLANALIVGDDLRKKNAVLKYDEKFIDYLKVHAENYLPGFKDVTLYEKKIISKDDILDRYVSDNENAPSARVERLVSFVNGVIDEYFIEHREEIYETIDLESAIDEDTTKLYKMKRRELKHNVGRELRQSVLADPVKIYLNILENYINTVGGNEDVLLETKKSVENRILDFPDALCIVFTKCVMGESAILNGVKHILIDEAQDLSLLQHRIILTMFPKAKYTLLADTNQAINPEINSVSIEDLSKLYNANSLYLNRSYRSTEEINKLALTLLPKEKNYDIFTRNGEEVQYKNGENDFREAIKEYSKKSPSVAIITKTIEEARELHKELIKEFPAIRLCDNKSCVLSEAPIIMPLVLTKGLEFDSVVVYNRNKAFSGENNKHYRYMAVTRALHRLTILEM
ncbi:MAG: UvrD-helicase domain-containing protein, partial [Clostridia bacterium]|nr:UvrD-helicase domain-containing protein [Clostridia bacterium]